MSTAFADTLPLIKELKDKLEKLTTATDQIATASASAEQHKIAADNSLNASSRLIASQEHLVTRLGQQQQQALGEQEVLLREHAQELTRLTGEETSRQMAGIRQSAVAAQQLIDRLLEAQPPLLTAITERHEAGITRQQQSLEQAVQAWADSLHHQMQAELKLVRQATEVLQQNTRRQHDELSAINDQLQVATGRITAFAEVMNAARFTAKLEAIETGQQQTLADLREFGKTSTGQFGGLQTALRESSSASIKAVADLQRGVSEESAAQHETLRRKITQLEEQQRQQQSELQATIQSMQEQQAGQSKQSRLLLFLVLLGVAGIIALQVLLRG